MYKENARRIALWNLSFLKYDLNTHYRKGMKYQVNDDLSRIEINGRIMVEIDENLPGELNAGAIVDYVNA